MTKPIAILSSDWHIRDDVPISRCDDYFSAQLKKIQFIKSLEEKYGVPILVAGDIFHKAKSSQRIEAFAINNIPTIFSIPGNHDLPRHNLENILNSSYNVMFAAGQIINLRSLILPNLIVTGIPYNRHDTLTPHEVKVEKKCTKILMLHTMVHKDTPINPNIESTKAITLLKKYSDYDVILTGDNHETFIQEYDGRVLFNPGSLMRANAAQKKHKPSVFVLNGDLTFEQIFLPIEENVWNTEHIEKQNIHTDRMELYTKKMKEHEEIGVCFENNIKEFIYKNNIRQSVSKILEDSIYE